MVILKVIDLENRQNVQYMVDNILFHNISDNNVTFDSKERSGVRFWDKAVFPGIFS